MAQQEGTNRQRAGTNLTVSKSRSIVPGKSVQVKDSRVSKKQKRKQAFNSTKSLKQREACFLRKWNIFSNAEPHPPPLWFRSKDSWKQGPRADSLSREGPAAVAEGACAWDHPQPQEVIFPRRERWLFQWSETPSTLKLSSAKSR